MADGARREAIRALNALAENMAGDPEVAHSSADAILLGLVPEEVAAAYYRVVDACAWWATA